MFIFECPINALCSTSVNSHKRDTFILVQNKLHLNNFNRMNRFYILKSGLPFKFLFHYLMFPWINAIVNFMSIKNYKTKNKNKLLVLITFTSTVYLDKSHYQVVKIVTLNGLCFCTNYFCQLKTIYNKKLLFYFYSKTLNKKANKLLTINYRKIISTVIFI